MNRMNRREKGGRGLRFVAVLVATVGLLWASGAVGQSSSNKQNEVDHVALAGTLVRDGHYDRAKTVLSRVDLDKEGVDKAMYYTLRGLVALKAGAYESAIEYCNKAIHNGQHDEIIFVHLAQAHYSLNNWEKTIQMVRNAAEDGEDIPDLYLMKAESYRNLDRLPEAWQTLVDGRRRFPDKKEFLRQQVFLLVKMGLYREALKRGKQYVKKGSGSTASDYIALAQAFRRAGEHGRAQILLEQARLKYPDNIEVLVNLAHAYIGSDDLVAAAQLFQVAAEDDAKYLRESAELYRRDGAYERTLYLNSRITDQRKKFKQRVAILLDRKSFERIASLDSRLSRLGLLNEQKILYALAYAHFKTRNYDRALTFTKQIDDRDLFESAVQLRRAIETCKEKPWQC